MKENRALLIFVGALLVVGLGMWLPDYFACHQIHLYRSAAEQRIEAVEERDLSDRLKGSVISFGVEYNTLTVVVPRAILEPRTDEEYHADSSVTEKVDRAWEDSYSTNNGASSRDDCLLFVWTDPQHDLTERCETRDSVARLIVNEGLC